MNQIKIRDIQHYMYCPHRWGLLTIDCAWAENYFVVKGDLLHKRVHDPTGSYTGRNKKVVTSLSVYHDELLIYGVIDCLELFPDDTGVSVKGIDGKYRLCIVEYKPTAPKNKLFHEEDAMQVFAQKLCVDYLFKTDCQCVIYYADTKQRVELPFAREYDIYYKQLVMLLEDMRNYREKEQIPPVIKSQNCNGCSLKDLCIPLKRKSKSVREKISECVGEL